MCSEISFCVFLVRWWSELGESCFVELKQARFAFARLSVATFPPLATLRTTHFQRQQTTTTSTTITTPESMGETRKDKQTRILQELASTVRICSKISLILEDLDALTGEEGTARDASLQQKQRLLIEELRRWSKISN